MEAEFSSTNSDNYFQNESQRLLDRIAKLQKDISLETANRNRDLDWENSRARRSQYANSAPVNRTDDDEHLRYFKDENEKLKRELSKARDYIRDLSEKNKRSITENRRANEAEAEISLLKQQLQAMRATMDKIPADETSFRVRMEVLEERLREVQRQNFDLRRELAGLTPERTKIKGRGENPNCEGCLVVLKQKALQTKYIIAQSTENRRQLEQLRNECQQLKEANEALRNQIAEMESKYEKDLKDAREYRDLYRRNSERAAKWYKTQMEGFTNDIGALKMKVIELEKYLVQAQLNAETDLKQQTLIEELKKITVEAAAVANKVKRWRNVYE